MNTLILGDGDEELAWARWILENPEHRLVGIYPGFGALDPIEAGVAWWADLESALAMPDVDLAIVGGDFEFRMEALRRVAALGWSAICLHPPGPDSEAYYQVSLSREETGAVIVPDIPLRLHPGITQLKRIVDGRRLRDLQSILFEVPIDSQGQDLVHEQFPKLVDVIRAVAGDVVAVWAIGEPRGHSPRKGLSVFLDLSRGCGAKISFVQTDSDLGRLILQCELGTLTFEYTPNPPWPARFSLQSKTVVSEAIEYEEWDPHAAIMDVLVGTLEGRGTNAATVHRPNLDDGIRAMELTEAVVRSLRRERKVDLHYQSIGEETNFKSVMTSTGCLVLLSILVVLPLALAGPALGLPWLLYISYLIPISLVGFMVSQVLRLAVRKPGDVRGGPQSGIAENEP